MRVYATHEIVRQSVLVYVEVGDDPATGDRFFQVQDSSRFRNPVRVAPGEEPPFWMRIPEQIANAVGEALAPRPDVTERHLDDAIGIRDRLLALVEKTWELPR